MLIPTAVIIIFVDASKVFWGRTPDPNTFFRWFWGGVGLGICKRVEGNVGVLKSSGEILLSSVLDSEEVFHSWARDM